MILTITSRTNGLHRLTHKCVILTIWLSCILVVMSGVRADNARTWSRTFSWADHKNGLAISLFDLDQGEKHLVGTFAYENYAGAIGTARNAVIEGVEKADGTFWPYVKFEVRKKAAEKWEPLGESSKQGHAATIRISPNTVNYRLTVNLDAFKPFIGKYELGRIILKTGESSEFQLKYLLPP